MAYHAKFMKKNKTSGKQRVASDQDWRIVELPEAQNAQFEALIRLAFF
jgi:hypothetical protein